MKPALVAIGLLFLVSCTKNDKPASAETILNVSYGTGSKKTLDLYLPANRTSLNTKVLILIHGGGWVSGDKADFNAMIPMLQFQNPDMAIANINYTLFDGTPATKFPACYNDVVEAYNYLLEHSDHYKYAKNFALLGTSAGGHLALLYTYKSEVPKKPTAVVSFFGPTDMADLYNQSNADLQKAIALFIGATPSSNLTAYQQASPIAAANISSSPTMLIHGSLDTVVNVSQAVKLKDWLTQVKVPVTYVNYPTEGHGLNSNNLLDALTKMNTFFSTYFR